MKEDLTTQELSKEKKARLAEKLCYEKNKEKRLKKARERYLKNKEKLKKCYESNRDERIAKMKSYNEKNREKLLSQKKEYYRKNKQYFKTNYEINKQSFKDYDKQYFSKNKKHINERLRKKYKENIQHKLKSILRGRLWSLVKSNKMLKRKNALNLVGCSVQELKEHVEKQWLPGMSWDNHTNNGWHIDHIMPCNTFDLTDIEQQKLCFHYSNLRPLWAADNLSRPDDGSDIINFPKQIQ